MCLQPKLKLMLKSKYVKAWLDGDKWIGIRKVSDVCSSDLLPLSLDRAQATANQ